ncbi:MAG TPA: 2-C-methyl-D-erythritol 2,4-cyclodiphosphate synthase [Candidatus Hydrogenedentes bacterium]|nr:2-C-methyl-D-erythritol 2,4-cyclodiphosphate synthase [Candidatus Hydrogenedentota bacterium]
MIRVGIGYDLHRLVEGRPLKLGGVKVPFEFGLEGHSDADALAHAITDALLGAAALGNIGQHFPDTDTAYKNADSMVLLKAVDDMLTAKGWRIVNIDSNVIAQRPKLNPFIDAIRENIAKVLGLAIDAVSVKAKTNENVGPEGRGEAIATNAVVLIERV